MLKPNANDGGWEQEDNAKRYIHEHKRHHGYHPGLHSQIL